jgi:DNA polymerase-4
MERSIIHLNVADFAVAVEQTRNPGLKGAPVIIAPPGTPRAVVYDMSEEAFQDGVQKGMPLGRAFRLSPRATLLPPCPNLYERAMKALISKALAYSPRIESGKRDGHLFIDATGTSRMFGPAVDVGWRLNKEMKTALGLDPVWSVATSKLVAKVATRLAKPLGEYIVGPGEEAAFLAPLPLEIIPGLGAEDLLRLREFNLSRVFELRSLDFPQLETAFGKRAGSIFDAIRGVDAAPVARVADEGELFEADHEFPEDTNDGARLKQGVHLVVASLCQKLRRKGVHCATLTLVLTYSDGIRRYARMRLKPATSSDFTLFRQGLPLLYKAWNRRIRIRHMRLVCDRAVPPDTQLDLFADDTGKKKEERLVNAMERIRERFGPSSVGPGLAL